MRTQKIKQLGLITIFIVLLSINFNAMAQGPKRVKIGIVAPKGSIYHRVVQQIGEDWREEQTSKLKFTVYTDSSQGSEADMVRRMRVGQLNGAMLTVVGLSEIDDSVSALQKMPMMFRSWEELDYVRESIRTVLEQRLAEKGFIVLFWGEGGWVQFFAKRPMLMPEEYKKAKFFAWAGDSDMVTLMKSLKYTPVVLELSDILPGLQTNLINVVPAAPMFALAGQIDRNAPYMLHMNWVPIVGATIITKKTWDSMTPQVREVVMVSSEEAAKTLRVHRNTLDDKSIQAMVKRGLKVQQASTKIINAWRGLAETAYKSIRGTSVPSNMFDRVVELLSEYRGRDS